MLLIKNKFCQIPTVLFFVFFGVSFNNYSFASSTDLSKSTVTLHAKEVTFNQLIKKIEDLTDIQITIKGVEPSGRKDISINQKPIEKVIPEILRLYSVKNHSAIYYSQPKPGIELLIVSGGDIQSANDNNAYTQPVQFNSSELKTLTKSEFNQLKSATTDDFKTLDKETFAFLPSDPPDGLKELSEEEFSRLLLEPPEPFKTLKAETFSQLPKKE